MSRALLIGAEPAAALGYTYVTEPPYDTVVIGSLSLAELLHFGEERTLEALADGKSVVLYTPGLPDAPKNRGLSARLASSRRELKSWGVVFTDGSARHLVTAEEAKQLRVTGKRPAPGAVLTPLAREILEGTD